MNRKRIIRSALIALVFVSVMDLTAVGQQPAKLADAPADPSAPAPRDEKIKRWFEMDTFTISTRYRHITNNVDLGSADVLQFQVQARGRFKFDKNGKYSVTAGIYTGNRIDSGWGSTGWGTGGPQTNLYVKQLYFTAKPVKPLEIQVGGLSPNNGENTEITGYDNDSYFMGERVTVRAPKQLYFDEISAANGYFGDITTPSVFRRFDRLDESNYHQFLVRKRINKNVSFSADYTFEAGRDTFRQAVKFSVPGFRTLDSMRFENYQRVDPDKGYGFAFSGEKTLRNKLNLNGGFAHIDTLMFNGDRYPRGNRIFAGWNLKMIPELSFGGFWIQGIGPLPTPATPRTRFELILSYNVLESLKRFKLQ